MKPVTDALSEIAARPHRYENVDGTGEMQFGLMILSCWMIGVAEPFIRKVGIFPHGFVGFLLGMYSVFFPFMLAGFLLSRAIKKHITYPRTGYAAYRRFPKENRWKTILFFIGIAVVAAGLAALVPLLHRHQEPSWLRAFMVLGFVVPYAVIALKLSREHPWKRYVIAGMAVGLLAIVSMVPGTTSEVSRPVMLFTAATWLGSSAATLILYIRHTHPPVVGEE
ncbi:MAG: hypothetical protein NTY38_09485 [Acidobacteria bacterium]|nr:hypothetical protein [Acidobacteriota bacterium]